MFSRLRAVATVALLTLPGVAVATPARAAGFPAPVTPAIVGGETAAPGAFPSVAFVAGMFANGSGETCSGAVVAPALVLTAGHCAENPLTGQPYAPGDLSVITGTQNLIDTAAGQTLPVVRVFVNPGYAPPNESDDVALLQLGRQTSAPPLRLAVSPDVGLVAPGTPATIAGWGRTSQDASAIPLQLQTTTEAVTTQGACESAWSTVFDPISELCGQSPSQTSGACSGDSGGPLIADDNGVPTEIGLTDYVAAGCDPTVPNVFARSDSIAGWAEREIVAVGSTGIPATASTTSAMTPAVARVQSRIVLTQRFPKSIRGNAKLSDTCARLSRTGFLCATAWSRGFQAYSGSVAVTYAVQGDHQIVVDHTLIHRLTVHQAEPARGASQARLERRG